MGLIRHNMLNGHLEKGPREALSQIWLICGEPFLVRKAFEQLTGFLLRGQSKAFGLDTLDGRQTPVGDVIEQVTTFSFLQSAKVIAVKEAPLFTARAAAGEIAYSQKDIDLLAGLAQKGIPEGHILVMTSSAPDKRKKIYKTISEHGTVVDCTVATGARKADLEEQQAVLRELSRQQLAGTGKQIDSPAFQALVEQTGFNPELFAGNIEKLLAYTGTRNRITAGDVAAVVHRDKKDPIFSLTNAVMDRDTPKALALLNALFAEGFHPLQILKTLENQVRKLLAIKLFLLELRGTTPGLPPLRTMHFNGFKQVMMPRIQAWDKAAADADNALEAALNPQGETDRGKKAKPAANDLLLAPNPKSAYPVFQNFQKSEHFSLNELTGAMMMLSDLDMKLKTSAVQAEIAIEFFIMTLCRKKEGALNLRKTKIIATVSNLNCSPDFIGRLHKAGVNVVRLNTAHITHEDALEVIENTRKVSDKIGILLDTKGPEIRTCDAVAPLAVKHGDYIRIKGAPGEKSYDDVICVSYEHFVEDVPVGSSVLVDDGCIALAVMKKDDDYLICHVENDGVIHPRKSINIPSVHVKLPALSEKDKGFIEFAADNDLDFIAHSFVRNQEDVMAVQQILDRKKSPIKIIAKIENSQGVKYLYEILEKAYGVMIARGDLAVEIPTEQIPLIQKQIVKTCVEMRRPVIVATQMLHSMIESPRPTRAEVSDVANACLDHADALMLSGETASGKYPEVAVRTMAKIAQEVEDKRSSFIDVPYSLENKVTAYLAKSAVKAALRLGTKGIVADSLTGTSILALAAYRGDNPIFAQVYDKRVMRRLSLSYGVFADHIPMAESAVEPLQEAICKLLDKRLFKDEDRIIVLAGSLGPKHGASFIEISTAESFREKCHHLPG